MAAIDLATGEEIPEFNRFIAEVERSESLWRNGKRREALNILRVISSMTLRGAEELAQTDVEIVYAILDKWREDDVVSLRSVAEEIVAALKARSSSTESR